MKSKPFVRTVAGILSLSVLLFPATSHAASAMDIAAQVQALTGQLSSLQSQTVETTSSKTSTSKGNATLTVQIKNLPDDWRATDGATVSLYDNDTAAYITGLVAKSGKAIFKNLKKGKTYKIEVKMTGYEKMETTLTLSKKSTKKAFSLSAASEESEYALRVIHPGSGFGETPVFTVGQPAEVWVTVDSPKAGTVQTYLNNEKKDTRVLLTAGRFVPRTDGMWEALKMKSAALPSSTVAGGGYNITATFLSDDRSISLKGTSAGLITISKTKATGPRITRFTGPSSLKVGQTGTWELEAEASPGQTAHCYVYWNQEPAIVTPQARGSSCTVEKWYPLSAVYKKAGTYDVGARIIQNDQQQAIEWLKVIVK